MVVAGSEFRGNDSSAHVNVSAVVVGARDPKDGADGHSVEHEDAFVSLAYLRDVLLGHDVAPAFLRAEFEEGVQVAVVQRRKENASAAAAVERLEDCAATLVAHEVFQSLDVASDQGWWDDSGEVQDVELFIRFAEAARSVKHERGAWVRAAQQVRGEQVGLIERGILAHEDGVVEVEGFDAFFKACEGRALPANRGATCLCVAARTTSKQLLDRTSVYVGTAALGFQHEDEGGVPVREDPFQRIHDKQKFAAHASKVRVFRSPRKEGSAVEAETPRSPQRN